MTRTPRQASFMAAIIHAGDVAQSSPFAFPKDDSYGDFVAGGQSGELTSQELGALKIVQRHIQHILRANESVQQAAATERKRQQERSTMAPDGMPEEVA